MHPLRQRMIENMQLRGFSARTQECYVAAVRQLAEHFHQNPEQLTEEDLRQYFLYLANEKKVARATATIALCGIKFFYELLDLLRSLFHTIHIPQTVYQEVVVAGKGRAGAEDVARATWIERHTVKNKRDIRKFMTDGGNPFLPVPFDHCSRLPLDRYVEGC